MRTQERQHCCQPLAAALSEETRAAGASSSCLVVRRDASGALYFRITTGAQEFTEALVNEPAAFCPFCGAPVDGASDTRPPTLATSEDDEELTLVACAATLVGA